MGINGHPNDTCCDHGPAKGQPPGSHVLCSLPHPVPLQTAPVEALVLRVTNPSLASNMSKDWIQVSYIIPDSNGNFSSFWVWGLPAFGLKPHHQLSRFSGFTT